MIAPSSPYGCGSTTCVACYGDAEWQADNAPWAVVVDGLVLSRHATEADADENAEGAEVVYSPTPLRAELEGVVE